MSGVEIMARCLLARSTRMAACDTVSQAAMLIVVVAQAHPDWPRTNDGFLPVSFVAMAVHHYDRHNLHGLTVAPK